MDKNKYLILGSIVAAITGVPSAYYLTGVSPHGEQEIAQHEGYRAKPYRDPGGVVTQGHGSTFRPDGSRIKMTDKAISKKKHCTIYMHISLVIKKYLITLYATFAYLRLNTISMQISFISMGLMLGTSHRCLDTYIMASMFKHAER